MTTPPRPKESSRRPLGSSRASLIGLFLLELLLPPSATILPSESIATACACGFSFEMIDSRMVGSAGGSSDRILRGGRRGEEQGGQDGWYCELVHGRSQQAAAAGGKPTRVWTGHTRE